VVRFGVYVPTFGEYDVETLARLAGDVEAAGWDGFFIWDHLAWTPDGEQELADTTVALTAIALATERVRFGALVTPLARRRPWKLAKETATLDRLSRGRWASAWAPRGAAPRSARHDAPRRAPRCSTRRSRCFARSGPASR
jgi:alkanesulfonate monooxygenase SsuD/methylene tetrahydromethanopterin reductase-like flavin-dependent oxidoreductase (luciferase family)